MFLLFKAFKNKFHVSSGVFPPNLVCAISFSITFFSNKYTCHLAKIQNLKKPPEINPIKNTNPKIKKLFIFHGFGLR